ncbi:hypothetical protein [Capnocytophaga sputigena]
MKKHTLKDIIRALVAEYLTDDGKTYNTKHYNLSAIIVVGIRLTRKGWYRSASGYSDFDKFFN